MNKPVTLLAGIGVGAGLMYMLDPDRGRRRRAITKDQIAHVITKTPDVVGSTARDLRNRVQGVAAQVSNLFTEHEASDDVLQARIRSKLGRVVSHPSSIEVNCKDGVVGLKGPILADEVDELLSCIESITGVSGIENKLEVHKQPGNVPGLQGGRQRPGDRFELFQEHWSPTARLLTGAAGGAMAAYGLSHRDPVRLGIGALGLGLLARGISNAELKRLLGIGAGRRAVDVQKTINIAAPIERVFGFWKNFENFPKFMSNVREVRSLADGRSHWVVSGPAHVPVEWDATVTKVVPNEVIAWKSEPGSPVQSAGVVHFEKAGDEGTRVQVRMSYNPPGGYLGHAVASLFLADPKSQMTEDLNRMKLLIEGAGVEPKAEEKPTAKAKGATG